MINTKNNNNILDILFCSYIEHIYIDSIDNKFRINTNLLDKSIDFKNEYSVQYLFLCKYFKEISDNSIIDNIFLNKEEIINFQNAKIVNLCVDKYDNNDDCDKFYCVKNQDMSEIIFDFIQFSYHASEIDILNFHNKYKNIFINIFNSNVFNQDLIINTIK